MAKTQRKRHPVDFAALAERFRRAANPSRLHVLLLFSDGERHVGDIAAEAGCSMSNLSVQLKLMQLDGQVEGTRDGKRVVYSLTESGREMLAIVEALGG